MPILDHLDLDAFFAAVEEIGIPGCDHALVVGVISGRCVVATANTSRAATDPIAMSAAEAIRRCPGRS